MMSVAIDVPAMYADHHVVEVRRILLETPGVAAVFASSAFRLVEVEFDTERTTPEALERLLAEAGYLAELPVPAESGRPSTGSTSEASEQYRRHTTTRTASGAQVGFRHDLTSGSPPPPESREPPDQEEEE